ncbi:MAG TPA: hypothetical protein VMA09_07980 [Candidatus Binataceae bacterium]|nr:hypothetical protein [Candidatus Binataceae bacterium]
MEKVLHEQSFSPLAPDAAGAHCSKPLGPQAKTTPLHELTAAGVSTGVVQLVPIACPALPAVSALQQKAAGPEASGTGIGIGRSWAQAGAENDTRPQTAKASLNRLNMNQVLLSAYICQFDIISYNLFMF